MGLLAVAEQLVKDAFRPRFSNYEALFLFYSTALVVPQVSGTTSESSQCCRFRKFVNSFYQEE